MKVTVTTRHIKDSKTSEKIKAYALKKTKRIERHVNSDKDPSDLRFVLSSEKFRDKAEIKKFAQQEGGDKSYRPGTDNDDLIEFG